MTRHDDIATERTASLPTGGLSRRQLVRRGLATGAAGAVIALAPPAPRGAASARPAARLTARGADPVEISFWKPPHGEDAELFKPLLQEFSEQHPDIKVTHNVVPWNSVDEAFTAAFASGDPPDVFYLPDEWYPKYVRQGQVAELGSIVGDLEGNLDPNMWSLGAYKGTQYGVPFLAVIHALLLNMDLFEEAGLQAPESWDELAEAAEKLTNTQAGVYGLAVPGDTWSFLKALLATGGTKVLSDDLTEVVANSPGGIASWEVALQRIAWENKAMTPISFTADQLQDLSLNGRIAMMWSEQSTIKPVWRKEAPDVTLDVIPLPALPDVGGQPAVWTNAGFLFMAENSEHKEQAAELIRFLTGQRVQEEYIVKGVDLISPMKEVAPEDPDPVVEKYLSYLPHGVGTEMSVHWIEATQALVQEAQAVRTGQKTAALALDDFADTVEPILDGE